jgi:glycerol uptake facilitator-like aquaporin
MYTELVGEALGTFFFLGVILVSGGNPLTIAVGLAAAVYLVSKVSSAHLNSTVSLMMFAKGDMPFEKCISYILAQVIGALLALAWYQHTVDILPVA